MLFYGGIAGGVLLIGLAGSSAATLTSYLFGSVTTVSPADLWVIGVLAGIVLVLAIGLRPRLFAVCQDEEFARVTGLPVRAYNLLIAVMAAVTVTMAMRTVGLLLVSALMVVPVATAQQLTRGFHTTLLLALALGVAPSLAGITFSYYVDVAPGAAIVVIALGGFLVAWPLGTYVRRRRQASVPGQEAEERLTGEHVTAEQHVHEHDLRAPGRTARGPRRLPARGPSACPRTALRRALTRRSSRRADSATIRRPALRTRCSMPAPVESRHRTTTLVVVTVRRHSDGPASHAHTDGAPEITPIEVRPGVSRKTSSA